jgi:hypothetical protein
VRVRIVRPSVGIMDGVSLSHLTPGVTYDVPAELGSWLMSRGVAEQVPDTFDGLVVSLDNPFDFEQLTQGVSVIPPLADAPDRAITRRRTIPRSKRR